MVEHGNSQGITLEEIFNFGPENHNRTVFETIKRYMEKDALVPFIGAGLSMPIYKGWSESLKWIVSKKVSDAPTQEKINTLIDNKEFLEAAQKIENILTPINLCQAYAELYSPTILADSIFSIRTMAVWLLPMLFTGIVITTNLDRTLEFVYSEQGKRFIRCLLPGDRPYVSNEVLSDPNSHDLFKLHGTIEEDERVDYSKIVFTQSAYDRNYTPRSDLFITLKKAYERKTLLFLGCSLEKDRTLDVLRKTIDVGERNFAIVNCKEEEIDKKIHDLGELGIQAILYPDGRYEAVRVILEALLEIINPDGYKQLLHHIGSINHETHNEKYIKRFYYNSNLYKTVGREEELEELLSFLHDDHKFRWWAIVGPGGTGKSRLGLSFAEQLPSGWACIHRDLTHDELSFPSPTTNTVYVIDSFQAYIEDIGNWIKEMSYSTSSYKIRLLLIERDTGDWEERLMQNYIKGIPTAQNAQYQSEFLKLNIMDDREILALMDEYATSIIPIMDKVPQQWKKEETGKQLLTALKEIDHTLRRPLYALFLTDSFLSGENPMHWDKHSLLGDLLDREENYLAARLRLFFHESCPDTIFSSIQTILCFATILDGISQDLLEKLIPEECKMLGQARHLQNATALMNRLGLGKADIVFPIQPDIFGEYYVLRWLQKKAAPEKLCNCFNILFKLQYDTRYETIIRDYDSFKVILPYNKRIYNFFRRLFEDYKDAMNQSSENWRWIMLEKSNIDSKLYNEYANLLLLAISYSQCAQASLWMIEQYKQIVTSEIEGKKRIINRIKDYYASEINKNTIHEVERVTYIYPDDQIIAEEYVDKLFEIIEYRCEKEKLYIIADQLKLLFDRFPKNRYIAHQYANILNKLIGRQSFVEETETLNTFSRLQKNNPKDKIIAEYLSESLYKYAKMQAMNQKTITIDHLEHLLNAFPRNKCIQLNFAKLLSELSYMQDINNAKIIIRKLGAVVKKYTWNQEIAILYTRSLIFHACRNSNNTILESIGLIENLWKLQCKIGIVKYCINGGKKAFVLFRIFLMYLFAIPITYLTKRDPLHLIESLIDTYKKKDDYVRQFTFLYAIGLTILAYKQQTNSPIVSEKIVLLARKRKALAVRALFAIYMFNLSCEQNDHDAITTLQRLSTYINNNQDLYYYFCTMLEDLFAAEQKIKETITYDAIISSTMINYSTNLLTRPEDMVSQFLRDRGLFLNNNERIENNTKYDRMGTLIQYNHRIIGSIIILLRATYEHFPITSPDSIRWIMASKIYIHIEELAVYLARELSQCISELDNNNDIIVFVDWIEVLSKTYPNNCIIAQKLAYGLFLLIDRQDRNEAAITLLRMDKLSEEYYNDRNIQSIYQKALVIISNKTYSN